MTQEKYNEMAEYLGNEAEMAGDMGLASLVGSYYAAHKAMMRYPSSNSKRRFVNIAINVRDEYKEYTNIR